MFLISSPQRIALRYPCCHHSVVPVKITIKNVPEEVRDELAARAALQRKSMQQFLLEELEWIASRLSAAQ